MVRYILDKDFNLLKVTRSLSGILWTCAKWVIATASLAAFYYLIFSLVVNTDEEKRLKMENRLYEKLYPEMEQKEKLISDVVKDLQARDNAIYKQIFKSQAPSVDPQNSALFFFATDSTADKDIVEYTERRSLALLDMTSRIDSNFKEVFSDAASSRTLPPMLVPVPDLKFAQVGASVGKKMDPFYKVLTMHNGIDLIAGQGTPVLATADGVVLDVKRSGKGAGNIVEIGHDGGYRTLYAHLQDIVVRKGERVKAGRKIANVGMSGNSFAPHLHYEVHRDSLVLDPVNFFFASFSPEDYMKAAYMAATTGQSLD